MNAPLSDSKAVIAKVRGGISVECVFSQFKILNFELKKSGIIFIQFLSRLLKQVWSEAIVICIDFWDLTLKRVTIYKL